MSAWNVYALTCLLGSCIVTAAQRGRLPAGTCDFYEYKDKGSLSGLTAANATEIFYSSRKKYFECKWHIYVSHNLVNIQFKKFKFNGRWPHCSKGSNITIYDFSKRTRDKFIYNVTYCGEKIPPPFYSAGPEVDVVVKGNLEDFVLTQDIRHLGDFSLTYQIAKSAPKKPRTCGSCGGKYIAERGRFYSPFFPDRYPSKCYCTWEINVREGYFIKFHFLSFSLEEKKNGNCYDYTSVIDAVSSSSSVLGHFCGSAIPADIKTTGNRAIVNFFSDFSKEGQGFDLLYESSKEERDLSGLRSIAAILGGVSFGIFVFLLLCSVLYKRYVGDQQSPTACGEHCDDRGDDYIDAVQAGAPPSYQIVMAAPDMYPRTPEISPAGSPNGSPTASPTPTRHARPPRLQHTGNGLYIASNTTLSSQIDAANLPLTPPPPYSAIVRENQQSFEDYPPPPSYEILSDSSDVEDIDRDESSMPQTQSHIEHEDSAALLPREELSPNRTSRLEGSSLLPQIGRLSLSDAVTNWRNRETPSARISEHNNVSSNATGGSSRRFPGTRSLSNFFHSTSKAIRREASDGGIWSRRSRQQDASQFAASLAVSLSSLKRRYDEDCTNERDHCPRVEPVIDDTEDEASLAQEPEGPTFSDSVLEVDDDSIVPSTSFERFSLSRHRQAQDRLAAHQSELRSLCSDNGSTRSIDLISTQSDSSRQYLVNLSGHDKSSNRSSHKGRSRLDSEHSFGRESNVNL